MIDAEYTSIEIGMLFTGGWVVRVGKKHDIAMGCGWIYDVLRSADIVCRVVKTHQVVSVHAIRLDKNTAFRV
jgi:hypothetical protein